jgi:DNA-binding LytR/AlgR family response regulator
VGNIVRLVMVTEVQFFQSDGKYTRVATAGGDALIRLPLKALIEQLDPSQFVQVHRAAIVNLQAIDHIARDGTAMEILLKGRTEKLAVSEAYGRQFRQM